jgi:hypothetical protein
MAPPRYEGPLAEMIGDEDVLRPTALRIGWLLLGLVGAVLVGFAIGLAIPRRRAADLEATR